jgi:AraC-like DNA-binding protein
MQRVDTTNPKANQEQETIFCNAFGNNASSMAEQFRMHLLGMYFNTVGPEWSTAGKRETDYVHHIDISLSGRRQVLLDKKVYQMETGEVWYLPANKPMARQCEETCHVIYFKFFCDCLPGVDTLMDWPQREPRMIGRVDPRQWWQWIQPRHEASVAELVHLRSQLVLWITKGLPELDDVIARHHASHARFNKVFEFVEDHLGADLRLPSLAAAYGRGATAFARSFLAATHMTPKEYITRRLNQKALQWVINSDLTMKEIAKRLRFNDEFYFSRFFQRLNGLPPSRYRRNFRGSDQAESTKDLD